MNASILHPNETQNASLSRQPVQEPWVSPPVDAWAVHSVKLQVLFTYYVIIFLIGLLVNWLCLLNINRTSLNASARYLMLLQCIFNTSYISINVPYKTAILYLQHTFLPHELKIFCGWLHIMVVFGSFFTQWMMAITRMIYIVFPPLAAKWFTSSTKNCLAAALTPVILGFMYASPSVHPCCYRFYQFTRYTMAYVGESKETQLKMSVAAAVLVLGTTVTCYSAVILKIRKSARTVTTEHQREARKDSKKENRLALLFGITICIWLTYLTFFYTIYWSGLFTDYSWLLLSNELLEQVLFFMDPIVYMIMSSDLRKAILIFFGKQPNVQPVVPAAAAGKWAVPNHMVPKP